MTSTIKVNNIQNQCGANIINENSNTITIGASGDTIALASGASQTGFGRTGTVDWQTSIKTADFTAASGEGYFVNTTSGAVVVTLPSSPSAGDIVSVSDYAKTSASNNITIARNGSNLDGSTDNLILATPGVAVTLVFADSTKGWKPVNSNEIAGGALFVSASGGNTVATCGDFKIHTFTSPGTFCVTSAGNASGSNSVEYLVVAGGGAGGGDDIGGGGGGGGFRFASPTLAPVTYPAKPLAAPANLPVAINAYPIAVGGGGAAVSGGAQGTPGVDSSFSTITSTGGGGGGGGNTLPAPSPLHAGAPGGSGGGGGLYGGAAGSGNTPSVSPPQGKDGVASSYPPSISAGGGGGAIASAVAGVSNYGSSGGAGGGVPNAFGTSGQNCGSNYYFSGGGAGTGDYSPFGDGGLGGGGAGGPSGPGTPGVGVSGTANTGGGGGGAGGRSATGNTSGAGGSGIVIIRYKFQ